MAKKEAACCKDEKCTCKCEYIGKGKCRCTCTCCGKTCSCICTVEKKGFFSRLFKKAK